MFCVRVAIPMSLFLCLFHDACFNAYSKNFNAHTHYQFLIAISVSSVFFFFFHSWLYFSTLYRLVGDDVLKKRGLLAPNIDSPFAGAMHCTWH